MVFERVQQQRLADHIVVELERLILEGSFKSGERLPSERALAERFGVSRPSLREALQKLNAKGLLVSRQGGGSYVTESLGASFSDPLQSLLQNSPDARRDLLEFRHSIEGSCAYYAALRATPVDHQALAAAFACVKDCYERPDEVSKAEEGAADARFHLAIAEASHNAVLLHTIKNLFGLFKDSVVSIIGGLHGYNAATRDRLMQQHEALYRAIVEGRADEARALSNQHIEYVQEALQEVAEAGRREARARRRHALEAED